MKLYKVLFFASLFAFASCEKEQTTTTDPNAGGGNNGGGDPLPTMDYYFHGDLDGSYTLIEDGIDGYSNNTGSNDEGTIKRTYATISNAADINSLELMMIKELGSNPSEQDVYDMFETGPTTFSNRTKNGIIINWKDDSGSIWTTDTRFGSASNSSCVITQVGTFNGGNKTFEVFGNINCKLYNLAGQSKTISNGKFVIQFHPGK